MPTWITRDGTKIDIKDMETSHIHNCIKMLDRIKYSLIDCYPNYCGDSDGAYWASICEERMIDEEVEKINSGIQSFEKELFRRNNTSLLS